MCLEIINLKYLYEKALALNDLQGLTCHKSQLNQTIFLYVIFQIVVFIFIVVSCNTMFQPLYHPAYLGCPLFIDLIQPGKSFLKFDCFQEIWNVVLQLMTIKMRTTVWKIKRKLWHFKFHLKNSVR